MAQATLAQMYRRPLIAQVRSTIKTPNSRISTWLGMNPGGAAEEPIGGRKASWDVFDRTREMASIRQPGRGPAKRALDPSSQKTAVFLRAFESYTILEDELFGMRDMGQGWNAPLDDRGQGIVRRQQLNFMQKFVNLREFATVGMLKGGFGVKRQNDEYIPVLKDAGDFNIEFDIPADHAGGTYYSIFSGNWHLAATDIPLELMNANAKAEELHGHPIRHIWCNTQTAMDMLTNTAMKALAGSVNTVFNQFTPDGPPSAEGIPSTEFVIVLRGLPHLTVHVYDGGLIVDGSFVKFFPSNYALLLPSPTPEIFGIQLGSERVRRNQMDEGFQAMGLNQWLTPAIDPAGFEQKTLDAFLPIPYIPKTVAYVKVGSHS